MKIRPFKQVSSVLFALLLVISAFPIIPLPTYAAPGDDTPLLFNGSGFQLCATVDANNNVIAKFKDAAKTELQITGHGQIDRNKWETMAQMIDTNNFSSNPSYPGWGYSAEAFDLKFISTDANKRIKLPINSHALFASFDRQIYFGTNGVDTSNVTDMSSMFKGAYYFNQALNFDTSNVTDMSSMFEGSSFNQLLNFTDTSNVTDMSYMFSGVSLFNQALNFDTSSVTNMERMFSDADAFNKPLNFNTSSVTNMRNMFSNADAFNKPLNFTDTSKVTNMQGMFNIAKSFNQALNFDTSSVTNMNTMFAEARNFNKPLNFDTSNVTDMSSMFQGAQSFNQPLNFNTSNVTNLSGMFSGATAFNKPLTFTDTSKVTSMRGMFYSASAFNQELQFDTSNVVDMNSMFKLASAFNQPVNFDTPKVVDMEMMFSDATSFNEPIHFTDTSKVNSMRSMFYNTTSYNQPVSFDISHVNNISWMFSNSIISDISLDGGTNANQTFNHSSTLPSLNKIERLMINNINGLLVPANAFKENYRIEKWNNATNSWQLEVADYQKSNSYTVPDHGKYRMNITGNINEKDIANCSFSTIADQTSHTRSYSKRWYKVTYRRGRLHSKLCR